MAEREESNLAERFQSRMGTLSPEKPLVAPGDQHDAATLDDPERLLAGPATNHRDDLREEHFRPKFGRVVASTPAARQSYNVKRSSNISRRRRTAQSDGSADYAAQRVELLRIAAKVFKEKGFQSTTLADIAQEAGLDRASVYYYVGSKEELFHESVQGVVDDSIALAKQLLGDEKLSSLERLHWIYIALMISYEDNYPATFVYIQEHMHEVAVEETAWAQAMMKKMRAFDQILLGFIRGAIEEGDLRTDMPPRLVENALFGMLNWTHRWFVPGGGMTGQQVAEAFWSIFTSGMLKNASSGPQKLTEADLRLSRAIRNSVSRVGSVKD
jgi:AcrR family transcriptional regulator